LILCSFITAHSFSCDIFSSSASLSPAIRRQADSSTVLISHSGGEKCSGFDFVLFKSPKHVLFLTDGCFEFWLYSLVLLRRWRYL
ncbi:hypothetical protein LINGRAHAP2_LOCUS3423, partial [Linum grandiflorum]